MLIFLSINQSFARDSLEVNQLANINRIHQDHQGFIWLGGQHGLTRFDGAQSINFSSDTSANAYPFNWIHDFYQYNNSLLLATETNGLWLLNTKTGEAEPIVTKTDSNSIFDITIFQGRYIFQTPNNLYEHNPSTGKTNLITTGLSINEIVHTDKQLYISSNSGLYTIKNRQLTKIISQPITALLTIDDTVVAVTANQIYTINDTGEQKNIAIADNVSQICKEHNQNNFFTASNQGIIKKYSASSLQAIPHHFENIPPKRIRSMLHDSSGVLWLASNQGVDRLYENTIKDNPKIFDIITNANEIALFNDEIIMGTYGAGLQNFNEKVFGIKTNNNFSSKALKITHVLAIENELFIGTFDGLWQLEKQSMQVNKVNFFENDKVILKLKNKNNLLYIATDGNGLYAYDLPQQKIIWHIQLEDGLSNAEVIDLLPLDNGLIWLTTAKGIDIFNSTTGIIERVTVPGGHKFVSITLAENKIFAASLGNGIFVFNLQGQLIDHIGQKISFSGLLLANNEIWASARPGLYRVNTNDHKISMQENTEQYTFIGSNLIHNETLYSSHYGGVLEIDLNKKTTFNPKVVISKTTISGESYLLNKTIEIENGNDVVTFDLASLDFRPGLAKKYKYSINNSHWQQINNDQLTLTGLASGQYNIEIMATNSLGQWSDIRAYTEINVAYPWYWTPNIKIIYAIVLSLLVLLSAWLLYLRTKSIKNIHNLLKDDMRNHGRLMKTIQRNLQIVSTSLAKNELAQSKKLVDSSLLALKESINQQEPDNLAGKTLAEAVPYLANYIYTKYEVKLHFTLGDDIDNINYEVRAVVYKVIFEALMSAIFKNTANNFSLTLQEVKQKLWLTINSDNDSFSQLNNKVDFDLASFTIRQIINKNHASFNTFNNDDGSSQLVISFPLMTLS